MSGNIFENLRNDYKPNNVEVLFVGESRPQAGTFFYKEDSALYRETKKAFNEYFAQNIFTLVNFKRWNCWLYDISNDPVNGLPAAERRDIIRTNIPQLVEMVQREKPKLIIVCKKTIVEPEIRMSDIMKTYRVEENIFFLPFPGNGNQRKYREGLIKAFKAYNLKNI
jgi:hypothetical protein